MERRVRKPLSAFDWTSKYGKFRSPHFEGLSVVSFSYESPCSRHTSKYRIIRKNL